MGKNKLHHYNEVATFSNVLQVGPNDKATFPFKGKWASDYFKNDKPIVLELACGKGEYTIGMSGLYPEKNFIGIDVKGARIWRGAKTALEEGKTNVAFLRIMIEWLDDFFAPGEVSEIWITFPDPYLSSSKTHKRLTSTKFMNLYSQILQDGGFVNLKTDDPTLYQFTQDTWAGREAEEKYPFDTIKYFKVVEQQDNVYLNGWNENPLLNIRTHYERMHLGNQRIIKYIRSQFKRDGYSS